MRVTQETGAGGRFIYVFWDKIGIICEGRLSEEGKKLPAGRETKNLFIGNRAIGVWRSENNLRQ